MERKSQLKSPSQGHFFVFGDVLDYLSTYICLEIFTDWDPMGFITIKLTTIWENIFWTFFKPPTSKSKVADKIINPIVRILCGWCESWWENEQQMAMLPPKWRANEKLVGGGSHWPDYIPIVRIFFFKGQFNVRTPNSVPIVFIVFSRDSWGL